MFNLREMLWTFIFHIINAVVLYFILKRLLFKPVKKFLDARQARYQAREDELNERQSRVEEAQSQYKGMLEQANIEANSIISNARESADGIIKDAYNEAQLNAKNYIEAQRQQIELDKRLAMEELRDNVAQLSLDIASKIMKKNITKEDNQQIIDDFLSRVK